MGKHGKPVTKHMHATKWKDGAISDCSVCRPGRVRVPTYLKEGYKLSTQKTVKDSRGSNETLHWSGRQDVEIRPRPATVKGNANIRKE
jgi:hypothetical protein